jgi:glycosyltransferase involved in cell wall biosynthesis
VPDAPAISVCIPAYNRARFLPALLDSIVAQGFRDFEVLICEDCSPERAQIGQTARRYQARYPGLIRYLENERNLGYDGNLRHMIERAAGRYCLFMGNDDLLCPGALQAVAGAVGRHPNVGVVVRSYASFADAPENIVQEFRYFPDERFFPAGERTIATVFRRSVVISGMVVHREAARAAATERFDGILLYQLYLVANICVTMNAVFLPQIVTLYRTGILPDFGSSDSERGKFVPRQHTPESSLHFMRGMLDIARHVEQTRGVRICRPILRDIANYSYPVLAIQARKPVGVFVRYALALARMGFGRHPLFWAYFLALLVFGPARVERIIGFVKRRLGHTPVLGDVYRGRPT